MDALHTIFYELAQLMMYSIHIHDDTIHVFYVILFF